MTSIKDTFARSVGIGVTLIAFSYIVGVSIVFVIQNRLDGRVSQIAIVRMLKLKQTQEAGHLAELKRDREKATTYIRTFDLLVPHRDDLYGFEGWLDGLARTRDVSVQARFHGEPPPSEGNTVQAWAFTLVASGREADVLKFMEDIEPKQPYRFLMRLTNFNFAQSAGVANLSVDGKVFFR